MGVKKGHNNFAKMQKKKVATKTSAITGVIDGIPQGMRFTTITALTKYCAEKIGCHYTTILRQPAYMTEIRAWWSSRGIDPSQINKQTKDPVELRALLTIRESELALLKKENERLKSVVALLEAPTCPESTKASALPGPVTDRRDDQAFRLLKRLIDTKLRDVGITINGNGQLVDTGFGFTEIVADEQEMKPFLAWLKLLDGNQ